MANVSLLLTPAKCLQQWRADAGHTLQKSQDSLRGLLFPNQAEQIAGQIDDDAAQPDDDEELVAHDWLTRIYEPITRRVPRELSGKLEPAELFHEVLEHRWFLGERLGKELPIDEAARDYMDTVLQGLPDEEIAVGDLESMGQLANPFDPSQGFVDDETDKPYDPWEEGDEAPEEEEPPANAYLDIAALRARAARG